ncbi:MULTISPECIES: pyridoxamine 5'-phosphate oxidase family protein [Streptosporangium]|uniref:PPOX class probable F420-dependent enzyme n=1 Tax=Streptosporangium brasiliense TaxID=47480 RepID=A0ABT9RFH8_9ACTN|nr:pyridoxamine 5'-phosphate oxidase family protein [Streptosporangium brasiliense]MDP9868033.1 PPOX class probable F420-dependent enzyme [Streptosporangium brasiliense]
MGRAMTRPEREAFLAEVRVGVVSVVTDDGHGPLAVPMWYGYAPGGEVMLITPRDSRKARLIRLAGRYSLCVQAAEPPYRYVSVEGPVTAIAESVTADERRALARRYLGDEEGDRYVGSSAGATARMISIRMRPERWLSDDQS